MFYYNKLLILMCIIYIIIMVIYSIAALPYTETKLCLNNVSVDDRRLYYVYVFTPILSLICILSLIFIYASDMSTYLTFFTFLTIFCTLVIIVINIIVVTQNSVGIINKPDQIAPCWMSSTIPVLVLAFFNLFVLAVYLKVLTYTLSHINPDPM